MSLVAVNVYAERFEGEVTIWLVFSQPSGEVYALTLDPDDIPPLIEALTIEGGKAKAMMAPEPPEYGDTSTRLCAVCGEYPGKGIYGWKCVRCWDFGREAREAL